MTELNKETLLNIATANKTAENIFDMFSNRQRMRFDTDLARLRLRLITLKGNLEDKDFYDTFKKLADIGVCSVIKGNKGIPVKVKWRYNILDVANSVTGKHPVHNPLKPFTKEQEEPLRPRKRFVVKMQTEVKKQQTQEESQNRDYVGILKKGEVTIEAHFKTIAELAEWSKKIA
jgi:hypothetical protein